MTEKIETFEDKIKSARHSRIASFLSSLLVGVIILSLIFVYFLTGISKTGNLRIKGNVNLTKEQINLIIHNNKKEFLLTYNTKKADELLTNYPLISSASVDAGLLSLNISIQEITPLCYIEKDIYFSDGKNKLDVLDDFINNMINNIDHSLPTFFPRGIADTHYGKYFEPLSSLDIRIINLISCFMPVEEVSSNMSYTYLFLIPSIKYEYYGIWLTVEAVERVMTYSRVKECVDIIENDSEKDYKDKLNQVIIGEDTYNYLPIGYSASLDALIQVSFEGATDGRK